MENKLKMRCLFSARVIPARRVGLVQSSFKVLKWLTCVTDFKLHLVVQFTWPCYSWKKKPWSKLRASPWQKSSLYCRLQGNMESSCLEKLIGTKKERKPSCTLCSNHGVRSNLKGHKHHCPFLNCHCERCVKGRRKRDIMKQQVRLRRKQMKDFGNRAYCVTPSQPQGKGE